MRRNSLRSHRLLSPHDRVRRGQFAAQSRDRLHLAHTMRSKELLTHQLRRVEKWLDGALTSTPARSQS
jgi:hypothetical protein